MSGDGGGASTVGDDETASTPNSTALPPAQGARKVSKPRKCGKCRQPGHTARNCAKHTQSQSNADGDVSGDGGGAGADGDDETAPREEKEPPHRSFTRVATLADALHPALRQDPAILRQTLAGVDNYLARLTEIRLQGQLRFHYDTLASLEPMGQQLFRADTNAALQAAGDAAAVYHRSGTWDPWAMMEAYREARDRSPLGGVAEDAFCVTFAADHVTDFNPPLDDDVNARMFPQWELHIRRILATKVPQLVRWRLDVAIPSNQQGRAAVIRWWSTVWTRAVRMSTFTLFHDETISFPDPLPRKSATSNAEPEIPKLSEDDGDEIIGEYESDDDPEKVAPSAGRTVPAARPAPYWKVARELTLCTLRAFLGKGEPLSDSPSAFAAFCRGMALKVPGITGDWHEIPGQTTQAGRPATTWKAYTTPEERASVDDSDRWRDIYLPMLRTMEREVILARIAVGNHPLTQQTPANPESDASPKPKRPRPLPMKVRDKVGADNLRLFLPYVAYLLLVARQCEEDAKKTTPRPPRRLCRRRPRNARRRRRHPRRRLRRKKVTMRAFAILPVPQPAKAPYFRMTRGCMRTQSLQRNPAGLVRYVNQELAPLTVYGLVDAYEETHPVPKDVFHPPPAPKFRKADGAAGAADVPAATVHAPPKVYATGEDPADPHSTARWWEPLFGGLRRCHLKPLSEGGCFLRSILTDGLQLRLCFTTECKTARSNIVVAERPDLQAKLEASLPYRERGRDDIWSNMPNRTTRQAIRTRKPAPEDLQNPDKPVPTCEARSLGEALAQFQSQDEVQAFFGRFDALAAADPGIRNLQSVVCIPLRGTDMPQRLAAKWEECQRNETDWTAAAWKTLLDDVPVSPVYNWTGRHAQEHCRTRQTRCRERKHRARSDIGTIFRSLPSMKIGGSAAVLEYSRILQENWEDFRDYAYGQSARMRNDRALRFGAKKRHIHHGVRDMVRFILQQCEGWEAGGGREEDGKILLAMGAAVTRPGMPGHAPAPHRGILEEMDRNWPNVALILTDEFRTTSKCHWACGQDLRQMDSTEIAQNDTDKHGRPVIPRGRSVRYERWMRRRNNAIMRGLIPADRAPPEFPKPPRIGQKERIEAKEDDDAYENWLKTPEGVAATVPVPNGRSSSRVFRCPTDCCGVHNIDRDVNGALNILMHLITTLLGQRRREGFERKWEIEQRWQREAEEDAPGH